MIVRYHRRLPLPPGLLRNLSTSSSPSSSSSPPPSLPIAAFIDLDNVAPQTFRRSNVEEFIRPLVEFGNRINNNSISNSISNIEEEEDDNQSFSTKKQQLQIEAFGNLSTRSYRSTEEKQHSISNQQYIEWDGNVAQSGIDENGILRCGICASKIILTKKDRAKYDNKNGKKKGMRKISRDDEEFEEYALYQKLKQHSKLHDNEQMKRKRRMNTKSKKKGGNKKLSLDAKEMDKYRKYEAAQVGFRHLRPTNVKPDTPKNKVKLSPRNDLFQILRELGVKVKSREDVDCALIDAADRWMRDVRKENASVGDDSDSNAEDSDDGSSDGNDYRGVLVVYSKDGDFGPLLDRAKGYGFLTVSATDEMTQTSRLLGSSDVVLGPFGGCGMEGEMVAASSPAAAAAASVVEDFTSDVLDNDEEEEDMGSDKDASVESEEDSEILSSVVIQVEEGESSSDETEDESDDEYDVDDGYDIKEVSLGNPLAWLSSVSSTPDHDGMQAMSVSDDGFNFMAERMQGTSNETDAYVNNVNNSVHWQLTDGSRVNNDEIPNLGALEGNAVAAEAKKVLSSIRQLKAQHITEKFKVGKTEDYNREAASKKKGTRKKQRYQCKGCGERIQKWGAFLKHMRECVHCTKEIRKMPRVKHVVNLDDPSVNRNDEQMQSQSS